MDMCLHRGGLRYRIQHHEMQRVVPVTAASSVIGNEIALALIEGQPAIIYEPRLLSGAAEQREQNAEQNADQNADQNGPVAQLQRPLAPPLFYAVIGYNGDTLAAVAADRVEIATFESGNDHHLPVNLILNRPDQ
jgi:NAD(P)-dependent dehydrogenase (short-subunit alcohol dehydrogenase family)